jgi:glutaminase
MTKLSMHESLPFDEATAPSLVSTGELPQIEQVRGVVTEAYERYRSNGDGAVADYIPALAGASPGLFGISVVGARGRFFEIGDVETAFSIQSVSKPFVFALVCEAIGYEAARHRLGVNSTGFPFNSLMAVELNDERTMNPLVNAGAIATTSLVPGNSADEKWVRIRDGLSRFAGRRAHLKQGCL